MVYRVADLVDTPHLRVELQAGAAGLDRQVAWAQTSDLRSHGRTSPAASC